MTVQLLRVKQRIVQKRNWIENSRTEIGKGCGRHFISRRDQFLLYWNEVLLPVICLSVFVSSFTGLWSNYYRLGCDCSCGLCYWAQMSVLKFCIVLLLRDDVSLREVSLRRHPRPCVHWFPPAGRIFRRHPVVVAASGRSETEEIEVPSMTALIHQVIPDRLEVSTQVNRVHLRSEETSTGGGFQRHPRFEPSDDLRRFRHCVRSVNLPSCA